jgi:hypothetical protein
MRGGCEEPLRGPKLVLTLRQSVWHMTSASSGRSNHVCYGQIATELVHHGDLT